MQLKENYELITEVTNKVKEILEYKQEIDLDQDLGELGLDSLASVTLLVELEEMYNIQFEDEEMLFEYFSTIAKIKQLISNKL